MTAQRLVRGGKARIVIGVCVVLLVIAAIFHHENGVSEFENLKKNYETCTQQGESLSVNLQVIVDYKNKLEKSLQQEKAEHKQTRTELEARVNDEKLRRDKTSVEANLRFTSLQQHYKLLQAKHDDLKIKLDKLQQKYMEEIDQLESKVKELQEQIKQAENDKKKSLEHLKTEYLQLQDDKQELQEKLKGSNDRQNQWENEVNHLTKENHELHKQVEVMKRLGPNALGTNYLLNPDNPEPIAKRQSETSTKSFARQVEISSDIYQIQDSNNKPIKVVDVSKKDENLENAHQIDAPKLNQSGQNNADGNVLPKPLNNSKSTTKTSSAVEKLAAAQPLYVPTVTPETKSDDAAFKEPEKNSVNVLQPPMTTAKKLKLPKGVVPIPKEELPDVKIELPTRVKVEDKNIPDDINLALPNRYRNNIIESEMQNEMMKETKVDNKQKQGEQQEPDLIQDTNLDNNAMEVMDQPKLAHDNGNDNNVINQESNDIKVQENEHVLKDPIIEHIEKRKKQHIDMLKKPNEGVIRAPDEAHFDEGDYDREGHKEDLHIDDAVHEPDGEEDDDPDDYGVNLGVNPKDLAVRN